MKWFRLFSLVSILFSAMTIYITAAADMGDEVYCTLDPTDSSGLPECFTPQDNECYPGGVLYREENQDGCTSEWHWKAGWYLARFNNGTISLADFPDEFASVLPPQPEPMPTQQPPEDEVIVGECTATYDTTTGVASANFSWTPQADQDGYSVNFFSLDHFTYVHYINDPTESSNSFSLPIGTGRSFTTADFQLYAANYTVLLFTMPCVYTQT